jgi:hypothetical protein
MKKKMKRADSREPKTKKRLVNSDLFLHPKWCALLRCIPRLILQATQTVPESVLKKRKQVEKLASERAAATLALKKVRRVAFFA